MKKLISLVLAVLMLGILCLPAYAVNNSVPEIIDEAGARIDSYVHRFEYNCLSIPATLSSVIFVGITVEINGEDVDFDSVLDLDKTEFSSEDTLLVFPKEEEYVEPIIFALDKNLPFLLVEKTKSAETNSTIITVSLPGMTKEMLNFCESQLDAYANNTDAYINIMRLTTEGKIISAGGSDADKATFDAICYDAVNRMNDIKEYYAGCIRARRDLYLEEHPEDADEDDTKIISTVLSEGNLTVLCTVAAAVVFGLGGYLLGSKKKKEKA